ncbi:MAG: DUF3488 domain-containing transglutaminase family protein [Gammaproteobacteria bacterium]|nr:DUF3488 domain-containing transglutaminase family protein [Gammaproteobacteria bacterium]
MLLDNRQLFQLAVLLQLLLVPALWPQLQLWVVAVGGLTLVVRGLMLWRGWRAPRSLWLSLLALLGACLLALEVRAIGVLAALINILWLGYSLKFIEVRRDRDIETVLVLGFFLIALALVYRQSIGWALVMAVALWLAVTSLAAAVQPGATRLWRVAGGALLVALPLLLTLFLVLPRLPPLWRMPVVDKALSGLSEEVSPGEISELIRSSELVFRASFSGSPPAYGERYFPVMRQELFDGRRWSLSPAIKAWQERQPPQLTPPPTSLGALEDGSYEVIAEPQRHRWAFALERPEPVSGPVLLSPFATLYRSDKGDQRVSYRVASSGPPLIADGEAQQLNLQLPDAGNPKARAYGRQLASRYPTRAERVTAILDEYRQQPFYYTLQPPRLGEDAIDDFLFDSRRGFCGHYASATAMVLRAAGVPARLVTGYQGGEWNPQGRYLAVHQFDAHAWVEYVDEQGRWQPVDPTAAVSPARIEEGVTVALDEEFAAADRLALSRYREWALLNQLRWWGTNIDYQWTRLVLNYDAASLWQQVGQWWPTLAGYSAWLILGVLLVVATVVGGLLLWPSPQPTQVKLWRPLLRLAKRRGWRPREGESLASWCERLAVIRPQLRRPLQRCAWLYRRWRYAPLSPQQQRRVLAQFKRRLRVTCRRWSTA